MLARHPRSKSVNGDLLTLLCCELLGAKCDGMEGRKECARAVVSLFVASPMILNGIPSPEDDENSDVVELVVSTKKNVPPSSSFQKPPDDIVDFH